MIILEKQSIDNYTPKGGKLEHVVKKVRKDNDENIDKYILAQDRALNLSEVSARRKTIENHHIGIRYLDTHVVILEWIISYPCRN